MWHLIQMKCDVRFKVHRSRMFCGTEQSLLMLSVWLRGKVATRRTCTPAVPWVECSGKKIGRKLKFPSVAFRNKRT
jgi:hypothetical protein